MLSLLQAQHDPNSRGLQGVDARALESQSRLPGAGTGPEARRVLGPAAGEARRSAPGPRGLAARSRLAATGIDVDRCSVSRFEATRILKSDSQSNTGQKVAMQSIPKFRVMSIATAVWTIAERFVYDNGNRRRGSRRGGDRSGARAGRAQRAGVDPGAVYYYCDPRVLKHT